MKTLKSGFTLLELMTVIAIMAVLGTASIGGYSAMQRGIRERGAVATASGLLRAAQERASIDRVPTAVFCYNKIIRDDTGDSDEATIVVGMMTAVRRSGRLTNAVGKLLYDEFSDLNLTYTALSDNAEFSTDGQSHSRDELDDVSGMRLYQFPTGNAMEYSIVASSVWTEDRNQVTLFSGTEGGNMQTNCLTSAFWNKGGSKHEPQWNAGSAYAFEIGEIQLPHNMTFGKNVPSDMSEIALEKVILFKPGDHSTQTVEIYTARPGASGRPENFTKAGKATSNENEKL